MTLTDTTNQQIRDTRHAVLEALRACGRATIQEVAERVNVKAATVRHHLSSLHADGLVDVEERRQSVGRPVHVYHLTRLAERLFPHSYHLLIDRLLDHLKEQLTPEQVSALVDSLAASMADDVRREIGDLPDDARRERLIDLLNGMGLSASWQRSDDGLQLVKYHCPYFAVGEQHPELCLIDEAMVQAAVEQDVHRAACLLHGDNVCTLVLDE